MTGEDAAKNNAGGRRKENKIFGRELHFPGQGLFQTNVHHNSLWIHEGQKRGNNAEVRGGRRRRRRMESEKVKMFWVGVEAGGEILRWRPSGRWGCAGRGMFRYKWNVNGGQKRSSHKK